MSKPDTNCKSTSSAGNPCRAIFIHQKAKHMIKGKFELTPIKKEIYTGKDARRDGSGEITRLPIKLLPTSREIIYKFQDQWKETHGWSISASMAINELIILASQLRERDNAMLLPGYEPGLFEYEEPAKNGDKVRIGGLVVTFRGYLPGNRVLVEHKGGKFDMPINEVDF